MKSPELFIPGQDLILPLNAPSEVDLGLILDSNPRFFGMAMRAVLWTHFPVVPEWTEHHDGRSGIFKVVDSKYYNSASLTIVDEDSIQITPKNNDGILVHDGRQVIITAGVKIGKNQHIWWGATTIEDIQQVDPSTVESFNIMSDDEYIVAQYLKSLN